MLWHIGYGLTCVGCGLHILQSRTFGYCKFASGNSSVGIIVLPMEASQSEYQRPVAAMGDALWPSTNGDASPRGPSVSARFGTEVAVVRRLRRNILLSALLIVSAGGPASAQNSAYENMRDCWSKLQAANQNGATDLDRVQIQKGCAARSGQPVQANDLQRGIELEAAGRYPEAAAAYQAHMNAVGRPNGDGYVAGERLAFLYANGHGVPKNIPKARSLLSAGHTERYQTDLSLLDHNMLPDRPEDVPAASAKLNAIVAEQNRRLHEEQLRAEAEQERKVQEWRAAHPQEAHAQDVQACRASCQNFLRSCNTKDVGDFSGLATGTFYTHNYNCGPKAQACFNRCG